MLGTAYLFQKVMRGNDVVTLIRTFANRCQTSPVLERVYFNVLATIIRVVYHYHFMGSVEAV